MIQLTDQEANYVYHILNHVGGPPSGPRGIIDAIKLKIGQAVPLTTEHEIFLVGHENAATYIYETPSQKEQPGAYQCGKDHKSME